MRFDTGRDGITGVTIRLHGSLPPLHVLLRHEGPDGHLRDMRVATDKGAELDEMLGRITKSATRSTALLKARHNDADVNKRFERLWGLRKGSFAQVHEELKKNPDFAFLTGAKCLQALDELANATAGSATRVKDIYEVTVKVPLPSGKPLEINLLRRLDAKGMLADIDLLPESENGKVDLLKRMEKAAGQSATRADPHRKRDFSTTLRERRKRVWEAISADFKSEYAAHCKLPKNRTTSGAVFVKHLDQLCGTTPGEQIHHADKTITRHFIQPPGSNGPLTLLRYSDERGLGALRKVRNDRSNEQESLRAILEDIGKLTGPAPVSLRPDAAGGVSTPTTKETTHKTELKSASLLKRALELMLDNKNRGVNPFEGVAQASGIPVRILTSWVSAEGALKGSARAILRVNGYPAVRDELATLFNKLGQHASANSLPPLMSTGLMVRVLQTLHANPSASHEDLAARVNTTTKVIKQRIDVDTKELLMSDTQLRRLSDYEKHREELRACLVALKQTDRAERLPTPETQAEMFLRNVHEKFYSIAAALEAMRRNSRLSSREAAAIADDAADLPALIELFVKPGGVLLNRNEIAAHLRGFEPGLAPRLDLLLQHLEVSPVSQMATVVRPRHGVFSSPTIFVVNRGEDDKSAGVSTRLATIYAHSPDLVRKPRSYRNERAKQALRWLSTVLNQQFPKAVDIQCYWDAESSRVWVSSNKDNVNESIRRFLHAGKLTETLLDPPGDSQTSRQARHTSKLRGALVDGDTQGFPAEARELLKAMTEPTNYHVPMQSFHEDGARVDLHAERRIQAALREEGKQLHLKFLGGIRRPCTICAKELGLPDTAHRGPAWLSRAAEAFVDTHAVVIENLRKGIGTYATQAPNGKPILDYDTDSDSEAEDAPTRQRAKHPVADDVGTPHAAILGKRSARDRRTDMSALSMIGAASGDASFAMEGRAARRQAVQMAAPSSSRTPALQSAEATRAPTPHIETTASPSMQWGARSRRTPREIVPNPQAVPPTPDGVGSAEAIRTQTEVILALPAVPQPRGGEVGRVRSTARPAPPTQRSSTNSPPSPADDDTARRR